jgi:hypothetical protein
MKHLNGAYSLRMNRRFGWDGAIFRDRYTNVVVDGDNYLKQLLAYIHLNPVRAGMCHGPEAHPWSSYRAHVGLEVPAPWLTMEFVRASFPKPRQLEAFTMAALNAPDDDPNNIGLERGWLVSRSEKLEPSQRGPSRSKRDPSAVLGAVAAALGCPPDHLTTTIRGRGGNPDRRMLAWALVEFSGLRHREIAALLGTSTNAVSCLLQRVQDNDTLEPPPLLLDWRQSLKSYLGPEDDQK